ncbi:MAG: hypothetical protein HPY44_02990 [Armatimonadetes bacterium]|nr:hypothetical protein [Armatimonadota bacterium]
MPLEHQPDFRPSFHCDHPPFWAGSPESVYRQVDAVRRGEVTEIATSPGGRPIHLVAYGEPEPFASRANFNSAVGARDMTAYADKSSRTRPVVFLLGPVHGEETNGSTGCVNMMSILETGADLRGKAWPELRELADTCRVLIVPLANPDGTARFTPGCFVGCSPYEVRYWAQGTWADTRLCEWPDCKAQHPMRGPNTGFLGAYFNDDGINPMHDEFFAPMGPEAPAILDIARREAPELICGLHGHPSAVAVLEPAYVPMYIKRECAEFARRLKETYSAAGIPFTEPFTPGCDGDQPPGPPFNLTSALFHVSGAMSFTLECPVGLAGENALLCTHEEILEMQLVLYSECFRFAHERLRAWPQAVC